MHKWSSMSRTHLIKLIYRGALFLSALIYFIVMLATGKVAYGKGSVLFVSFGDGVPVFLIITVLVFVPEMIMRFFPNGHEAMGNQKLFKTNYIPSQAPHKPLKMHWARTLLVFCVWALLNGIIGTLNILGIISDDVMVLISLAYSVCDLICIMFFCPFQAWMMKNKCCQTCRIYNWDYPMMFTPFLFLILKPGPILHYVLLAFALAVLLLWEITYKIHPKRFSELTNEHLLCKNCNEKLCKHNRFYPSKHALKRLAEVKKAENEKIGRY